LSTLAAVTIDEAGNETFVTSGALERLRKVSAEANWSELICVQPTMSLPCHPEALLFCCLIISGS